jgi:hypothetical protein
MKSGPMMERPMFSKENDYRAMAVEWAYRAQNTKDANCKRTLEQLAIHWLKLAQSEAQNTRRS